MHPKKFLDALDDDRIVAAISQAEQTTSGEIRVAVSHRRRPDALAAARQRFWQLGMERTPRRNAVLIYFVPRDHSFAIWGDTGIHTQCGLEFWQEVAAKISPRLTAGEYTEAVAEAVAEVGGLLTRHFPRGPDDQAGLPNAVVRGD